MLIIYILIGIFAGFALANMTPINAGLRNKVKSPLVAIVVSILVSTIVMGIATLVTKQPLWPNFSFVGSHPAFIWFGGVIGAIYVTSNIMMFPKIGAIETVVLPLLGQVVMGVVVDTFGLLNSARVPLAWMKIVGVLLLLIGLWIAIVLSEKNRQDRLGTAVGGVRWNWRVWGLIVGGLTAVQQTMNGQLGGMLAAASTMIKGTIQGSFFAFFIGLVAIVIISLIKERRVLPTKEQLKDLNWTDFLGGFFNGIVGIVRMWLRIVLSQTMVVALVDFGQILTGIFVQQFGWWKSPKNKVNFLQIIGLLIMFIGVLLIVGVF
ncbi:MAG TPA: DMT family transporter [Lactovum miscens]|uniref:DMT family transporter n=1 Tax=Lactovum miscens TaxID=190387 RepID=UPI002ED884FF